jgi:hypothetical protein
VNKIFLFSIFLLFKTCTSITGQSLAVPTGTFVSPVDYLYRLSGGFSELRETHFHAGIDIKPSIKGKKDRIYSIANGYISRIKISPGGYGYGVYIDHPEIGYTSVYGHMESFSTRIEEIAKWHQQKNESFEIDIPLTSDILPVAKGEVIGIMGNTGFSFGDHLHFEVRDTKTEKPINPFIFGFSSPDKIAPSLAHISIHGLDEHFHKLSETKILLGDAENGYISLSEPIVIPAAKVGFAIQVYDRADASHNKMGIYGLHVYADDKLIYSYHMDKISFDQSRQITGFYDYAERKKSGQTYSLCYKLPGIDIDFLSKNGSGVIPITNDKNTKIKIEAEDFHRNRKTLIFELKRSEKVIEQVNHPPYTRWINVGQATEIRDAGVIINFDKNALYRSIPFKLERKSNLTGNSTYQVHHEKEALKSHIELMIRPDVIFPSLKDKAVIVWISARGKKYNCGGTWQDGYIKSRISEFGTFTTHYDTIAPTIKSINYRSVARNLTKYRFELKDDLPAKGRDARGMQYSVRIDGKIIICPYTLMSSVLEIPIHQLNAGEHELLITAQDHCGNIKEFKSKFIK